MIRFSRRAVALLDVGDTAALRLLLQQQPQLIHQHLLFQGSNYFRTPTLLEFIAEILSATAACQLISSRSPASF